MADLWQYHRGDVDAAMEVLTSAEKSLDPLGEHANALAVDQLSRLGFAGRYEEFLAGVDAALAASDHPATLTLTPTHVYALARPVDRSRPWSWPRRRWHGSARSTHRSRPCERRPFGQVLGCAVGRGSGHRRIQGHSFPIHVWRSHRFGTADLRCSGLCVCPSWRPW